MFNIFNYLKSPKQIASELMQVYNSVDLVKAHCAKMIECHIGNEKIVDTFLDVYNELKSLKPIATYELQDY